MTDDNYNQVIANAVTTLTKTWEDIIFDTKFNKMGAIRFEKDLRAVGFYMVSLTSFPLREKLTRLNQMAMLLDLEELEDLYEIWGNNAGAITWRLTDGEVRRILRSRYVPTRLVSYFFITVVIFANWIFILNNALFHP